MDNVVNLSYVNNADLSHTGVPWWGTGSSDREHAYNSWMTDDEAKEALDWEVALTPTYHQTRDGLFVPDPNSNHVIRVDQDKILGTVGKLYNPRQNREMIDFGSTLVDDFGAKWDTVGSLADDKVVFATLRLDVVSEDGRGLQKLDFDKSDYYLWVMLHNSHTGQSKFTASTVETRAVCENTVSAAFRGALNSWGVRHVGDISSRVVEARRAMDLTTKYEADFIENAHKLVDIDVEVDEFAKMAEVLFPTEDVGKRSAPANEAKQAALKSVWLHSPTIDEDWRMTGWGAFNAVTEYSEHVLKARPDVRTPAKDKRMLNTLFGGTVHKLRDQSANWLLGHR